MSTRDQISAKVLRNLEDSGAAFFTATNVNDSLQDGYDDICAYCGQIEKSITLTWTSALTYYDMLTLVPDFLTVVAIYNYNSKRWLIPQSDKELDQIRWDWELWSGEPIYYIPKDPRYVGFCPRLQTATGIFELFYRASADLLSAESVPIIKSNASKLLEFYATCDLLESAKEFVKAASWNQQYMENREIYKSDVKTLAQADRIAIINQNTNRFAE